MHIEHYGVPGMKWGIRKGSSFTQKTSKGELIFYTMRPKSRMAAILSKMSKRIKDNIENYADFDIKDSRGNLVGNLACCKESKESLNIVWVSTFKGSEGKGYGTASTKAAISMAKRMNMKTVTLEVPSISPNARHIYEKLGFKETKTISDKNDVWGGLTAMKLDLKHASAFRVFSTPFTDEEALLLLNYIAKELESI